MEKGKEFWVDRHGKVWKVKDMTDQHVRAAFCFILRKLDEPDDPRDLCDATLDDIF